MEIINIDLGCTIESLIADDLERLTGKNKADLESMVAATREKIDKSHTERVMKKLETEQAQLSKHDALGRSFDLLKNGGDRFFSLSEMADPALPIFAPNASFVMQFNKYLREAH